MSNLSNLSTTERRVYDFLRGNVGKILPYAAFEHVISVKRGTANLRQVISRLRRKKKCLIETVPNRGIRLRNFKMPVVMHTREVQEYADEIQSALHEVMGRHADSVGFRDQISIIGVALGALLDQLPRREKEHFMRILIQNVKDARKYSVTMRMQ